MYTLVFPHDPPQQQSNSQHAIVRGGGTVTGEGIKSIENEKIMIFISMYMNIHQNYRIKEYVDVVSVMEKVGD